MHQPISAPLNADALAHLEARALADLQSEALWQAISAAYSEPHRAYHTLAHLHAMFGHFDALQMSITHRKAVALAIWFHDLVYDVGAHYPDNEFRSADAMQHLLAQHSPQMLNAWTDGHQQTALADAMIRSTKGHALSEPLTALNDDRIARDAKLFLDIDLSILSSAPTVIEQFETDIRHEFALYPLKDFALGRAAAMRHFLQRPRIYLADESPFSEDAARANLSNIVERWERVAR